MPRDRDILTYHSQEVKNDSNFDQDLSKVNQAEKGRNMPTRHLEKGKIMPMPENGSNMPNDQQAKDSIMAND